MLNRFLFAFALLAMPFAAAAQEAAKTPTAEQVIDRSIEATGGKAAYEKLKNRVASGTVEIRGTGLKGALTIKEAPEAKNLSIFEIPGIGKMEQGTDGEFAWEKSVVAGGRLLDGEEKAHAIRNAFFNGDLQWRKVFKEAKCLGSKRVEDKECWELEMTTPEGLVYRKYFDQKTGLMVCMKVKIKTQQMEVPTEVYPADYQKVDGVLYPHEMRMKALQQEMVIRIDKVQHNVELPADTFAVPAELKKKADKSKDK